MESVTLRLLRQLGSGSDMAIKHGHAKRGMVSSTHRIWWAMLERCNNPKDPAYPKYGGRGITVCVRWLRFEQFLQDMGERPEGLSLDRRDNDGGYSPGNCRWATRIEQNRNRGMDFHKVEVDGQMLFLTDAAEMFGLGYQQLYYQVVTRQRTVSEAVRRLCHGV